jgi:hypothetical protein
MEFGTTHNRSPVVVIHEGEAAELESEGFKGLALR